MTPEAVLPRLLVVEDRAGRRDDSTPTSSTAIRVGRITLPPLRERREDMWGDGGASR